ncbi:unnamed protein product [Paramecium primaurelia]|uniref:Uncharacterized protein n=1 Tax=Paramecium primaurelia TaxID=5886 RepID=A0A8S1LAS9_PARPR|nr:unnamed protein product [Paramecium primaurelia]
MQQQPQQNPTEEKKLNRIGKPKGMNTQKPLDKTNAWSSDQQSTQAIQALSRLGRFICFQQTGKKKIAIDQNDQNKATVDQNDQNKTIVDQSQQSKPKQKQPLDAPGIFLNSSQIQIVKLIGEYCQIVEKSNKNCIVFFFRSSHPEFEIINGVPQLINNFDKYGIYPALKKLAPMLNQKFLDEYFTYLQFQHGQLQYIKEIQVLYDDFHNKTLKSAETLLQCLFTKYLIKYFEDLDLLTKKNFQERVENIYEKFYNEHQTKQDYDACINELLACMQVEEEFDQQYTCD